MTSNYDLKEGGIRVARAKRAYEGTDAYEAGYKDGHNDGWEDCKNTILHWINSIKEKESSQKEITKTTKGEVSKCL